jgi:hypothetical protein
MQSPGLENLVIVLFDVAFVVYFNEHVGLWPGRTCGYPASKRLPPISLIRESSRLSPIELGRHRNPCGVIRLGSHRIQHDNGFCTAEGRIALMRAEDILPSSAIEWRQESLTLKGLGCPDDYEVLRCRDNDGQLRPNSLRG